MKHTNIAASLGWSEVPENVEGLFLQPEEAVRIDADLGNAAENASALTEANETISTLNTSVTELTDAATASAETISTQTEKISELEAQVAALGKGASGTGTKLKANADENNPEKEEKTHERYDSPNHPANLAASKFVRSKN